MMMGDEGGRLMMVWLGSAVAAADAPRSYFWTSVKTQGKKIEANPLNGIVLITRSVAYIIFGRVAILYLYKYA